MGISLVFSQIDVVNSPVTLLCLEFDRVFVTFVCAKVVAIAV